MNYIRHLNTFFSIVKNDQRLTASHVSLYMSLFQYWNFNRFHNPFSIYRENIMQLSKIGSKNTYYKCIKQLHEAKYIYYHPAPSKFQVVRISIVRLDTEEEQPTRYKQLDLFESPSPLGEGFRVRLGTDFNTGHVPILGQHGTDFNTVPVSKMGHLIKQTNKQRETPSQKILEKNKKKQEGINMPGAGVPNLGHMTAGASLQLVPIHEVEAHFQQHNYPNEEAIKFYNHYKSLGWKIQGKTPIEDWKALVEKWMTNAKRWERQTEPKSVGLQQKETPNEVQYLYDCFLENKKISHQITKDHFEQLQLQLTDEVMQLARTERINQVAGTNQHSLSQIWQAYLTNDPNNPTVKKDESNLIALAKRIAVYKHFQQCKQQNIAVVAGRTNKPP